MIPKIADRSVKDAKYSLFGVVNHSGSLNGGHYTAYVLESLLILNDILESA